MVEKQPVEAYPVLAALTQPPHTLETAAALAGIATGRQEPFLSKELTNPLAQMTLRTRQLSIQALAKGGVIQVEKVPLQGNALVSQVHIENPAALGKLVEDITVIAPERRSVRHSLLFPSNGNADSQERTVLTTRGLLVTALAQNLNETQQPPLTAASLAEQLVITQDELQAQHLTPLSEYGLVQTEDGSIQVPTEQRETLRRYAEIFAQAQAYGNTAEQAAGSPALEAIKTLQEKTQLVVGATAQEITHTKPLLERLASENERKELLASLREDPGLVAELEQVLPQEAIPFAIAEDGTILALGIDVYGLQGAVMPSVLTEKQQEENESPVMTNALQLALNEGSASPNIRIIPARLLSEDHAPDTRYDRQRVLLSYSGIQGAVIPQETEHGILSTHDRSSYAEKLVLVHTFLAEAKKRAEVAQDRTTRRRLGV